MATQAEKCAAFRRLHESGCFVMPNPWDIGSYKYLQSAGFKALATTSGGFAFSRGVADGQVPVDVMLAHIAELAAAGDTPLNADFEAGYAATAEGVGENVRRCVAAGVAGLSIEDYSGDRETGLYPLDVAVARLKAARAAIDGAGGPVVLTGRSEGLFRRTADQDETIRRLRAYAEAGADCLYAPGLASAEQISAIVKAVAPKPVNVLVGAAIIDLKVADYTALGVRRISTGSAVAMAAWGGVVRAAQDMAANGSFETFNQAARGADVMAAFR